MVMLPLTSIFLVVGDFSKGLISFVVLLLISSLMMVFKLIEANNEGRSLLRAIAPFVIAEFMLILGFLNWLFKNSL